uniref:Uncharacterized protein n=1 Tax=Chromera velia CCMP2878 TaxID=1169474 RepID=A0A0G4G8I5_9ALVE|eukprot:Cvel_20702.t1-p1 / transcript=Cvel_20702.t1 / gene=Cvel_20702 / organism=Chromera_velia_CCMP2878 / gene_product=hypothetical protein / transcript_product=hypothetical protein / location=Cvel_scaffold1884:23395-26599(+) / protein_length=235 / sequence_SO=supercontig / SO=protein_coding / is_pseudo=false
MALLRRLSTILFKPSTVFEPVPGSEIRRMSLADTAVGSGSGLNLGSTDSLPVPEPDDLRDLEVPVGDEDLPETPREILPPAPATIQTPTWSWGGFFASHWKSMTESWTCCFTRERLEPLNHEAGPIYFPRHAPARYDKLFCSERKFPDAEELDTQPPTSPRERRKSVEEHPLYRMPKVQMGLRGNDRLWAAAFGALSEDPPSRPIPPEMREDYKMPKVGRGPLGNDRLWAAAFDV